VPLTRYRGFDLASRVAEPNLPPVRVSKRLAEVLGALYDADGVQASVQVLVYLTGNEMSVRGTSAYLAFADRVYGRLKFGRLDLYARRRAEHLRIAESRSGSLVLVLREIIETLTSPQAVILMALAMKYLPIALRESATGYKNLREGQLFVAQADAVRAAARRDLEQARLLRAQRRTLEKASSQDPVLQDLSRKDAHAVLAVLARIYEGERQRMASAQEFSQKSVLGVEIERSDDQSPR
jgi:hypothetical protein